MGRPKLRRAKAPTTYGNNRIKIMGEADVKVQLNDKIKWLPLLVTQTNDAALFGFPWIIEFDLSLPTNIKINMINNRYKYNDNGNVNIDKLYKEFAAMFDNKLVLIKNVEPIKLQLEENTKPIALSARRVLLPLKLEIENELKRLEENNIIKKIDPSTTRVTWGTLMVVVRIR
ncbi:uncharacterized protein LOC135926819 [Gordionus sp. m RMFG-2023]|uniref:uncharacterized protein LOC135926819 n=1 Tax=Gordionus sp. m RMFG-2023 TaxID=3053472 RepID=UPI0031FCA6D0